MVGVAGEPWHSWNGEGGTLLLPARLPHYRGWRGTSEEPAAQLEQCGGRGCMYQGIGPEAVGQHHPLAESFVLIVLLGELGWPVNAKAGAVHCGGAPAGDDGAM